MKQPLLICARAVAVLLLGLGVMASSQAGLFEDDEARLAIVDLRQRLQTMKESDAQVRRLLVEMQAQIDRLQAEINQSRGAQEQLARDLSGVQMKQRDTQQAVDERLRRFEPISVTVDGRQFQADPAEKREYDSAMELFRKGDFAAAQNAFQSFVQRRAQSGYLPSALFWLGNASYALKDYKASLAQLRQMLGAAPDHARAPEAMLAISNVQVEMKDSKAARKTLEDLIKAHPQSEAANTARERLPKLR